MDDRLYKYPRTHHLEGSRLQPGDEDLTSTPFAELAGRHLVVEEKVDGANAAVSFADDGRLRLQSRGHYLTGGHRERHFALFKRWANHHRAALHGVLGSRYVLYGEWCYAKHTVFYDRLSHYFLEFDVLDRRTDDFLSTSERRRLLDGGPVVSVPVVHEGALRRPADMLDLLGPSSFIGPDHLAVLRRTVAELRLDVERALRETDGSATMEGLYVKVEDGCRVLERYKFVRASFLSAVAAAEGHWQARPVIPNGLRPDVSLFGAAPSSRPRSSTTWANPTVPSSRRTGSPVAGATPPGEPGSFAAPCIGAGAATESCRRWPNARPWSTWCAGTDCPCGGSNSTMPAVRYSWRRRSSPGPG